MTAPIVKRNTLVLQPSDQCPRCGFGKLGLLNTVLSTSPSAYWRFGDAVGQAVATDKAGANPGTYVGPPTLGVAGALIGDADTAITLDGTAQWVEVVDSATFDVLEGTASWSIAFWVNAAAQAFKPIVQKRAAAGIAEVSIKTDASGILVARSDAAAGDTLTIPAISAGWLNIVITYDGANMRGYRNGAVSGSAAASTRSIPAMTSELSIGSTAISHANKFAGSLDEVALWPRALSAAEVSKLWFAGNLTLTHLLSSHDESNARQCRDCACVTQDTAI